MLLPSFDQRTCIVVTTTAADRGAVVEHSILIAVLLHSFEANII